MGTNIYMRRIPTAEQKEELKRMLKQQYEDTVASIDRDEGLDSAYADWSLSDEIEKTRKQIYEEVHIGKRSYGWKFLFAPNSQHYEETKESILKFIHRYGWLLLDEYGKKIDPDRFWDYYVRTRPMTNGNGSEAIIPHSLVPATSMSPPLAFASPEMRISADYVQKLADIGKNDYICRHSKTKLADNCRRGCPRIWSIYQSVNSLTITVCRSGRCVTGALPGRSPGRS